MPNMKQPSNIMFYVVAWLVCVLCFKTVMQNSRIAVVEQQLKEMSQIDKTATDKIGPEAWQKIKNLLKERNLNPK